MAFDRIQRACSAVPRSLVWAGLACVLAWYAGRTWSRNEDWSTPRAIYLSSLEAAPDNAKLHHNAAYYLDMETEAEKKEFHLREAIRLYPPYISAYVNLGVLLSQTGREEASVDVYKKGIEMHYKSVLANQRGPTPRLLCFARAHGSPVAAACFCAPRCNARATGILYTPQTSPYSTPTWALR